MPWILATAGHLGRSDSVRVSTLSDRYFSYATSAFCLLATFLHQFPEQRAVCAESLKLLSCQLGEFDKLGQDAGSGTNPDAVIAAKYPMLAANKFSFPVKLFVPADATTGVRGATYGEASEVSLPLDQGLVLNIKPLPEQFMQ